MTRFPFVIEGEYRIVVIYSFEPPAYKKEDDGVEIF